MLKKVLLFTIVLVLVTGCIKQKGIKPGESVEITKTQEFYFGVFVTDDLQKLQPILKGKTEQEIINILVRYYDKYQILPEAAKSELLADMVWISPPGVKVEDPNVTMEPVNLTWKEKNGNTETTKTVDGYKLVIRARIVASTDAQSGDVILKMEQFNTLELANLYVVRISGGIAQVVHDSDIFVVAQIE